MKLLSEIKWRNELKKHLIEFGCDETLAEETSNSVEFDPEENPAFAAECEADEMLFREDGEYDE